MKTRLITFWYTVRSGYWFVPSVMMVGAILLSFLTVRLDAIMESEWMESMVLVYANKPEGARLLLSTVAGSMVTVGALVFSLILVVLSLAASQFGWRLLRNFMRDTGNQVVLGCSSLLSCIVYSSSERSRAPKTAILCRTFP